MVAILYLGYHDNGHHFEFFQTPQKLPHTTVNIPTVDHNMTPKPWISIPNIKIYLETKFCPNRRIFVFWIQNGHHRKPTMNINSQHHSLLGNQISPKSEDFFYLAAILYLGYHGNGRHFEFFSTPHPQMLPHTTVDNPINFHEV